MNVFTDYQQAEVDAAICEDPADALTAPGSPWSLRARHVRHRDVDRVALDLGGPAGHVVEQVRGQRHVITCAGHGRLPR